MFLTYSGHACEIICCVGSFNMETWLKVFPNVTIDERCEQVNGSTNNTSTDGDCYGKNFSLLCVSVHIFSFVIVIVNLFILISGALALKKKFIKSIRICEFHLILNLAFADMMTGVLSLIILAWDFTIEVQP